MRIATSRRMLTLCLSLVLLLGLSVPASASDTEYESGSQSCPGSTIVMWSRASGTVGHSIYGQLQGKWNNGSMTVYNQSNTSFESGSWLVWSEGGHIDGAGAYCY